MPRVRFWNTVLVRAAATLALLLAMAIALTACSASGTSEPDSSASHAAGSAESSVDTAPSEQAAQEVPTLAITAHDTTFTATFEDNSSVDAFIALLREGPLTLSLHDYGDFEKVGALGVNLPTNDEEITTKPGDIILYQSNLITIYYDTNTWSFTRLAHFDDVTRDDLLAVLGEDDVEVTFELTYRG